jgi:hypothetical protein
VVLPEIIDTFEMSGIKILKTIIYDPIIPLNNITSCIMATEIMNYNPDHLMFSFITSDVLSASNTVQMIRCWKQNGWIPKMITVGTGGLDALLRKSNIIKININKYKYEKNMKIN